MGEEKREGRQKERNSTYIFQKESKPLLKACYIYGYGGGNFDHPQYANVIHLISRNSLLLSSMGGGERERERRGREREEGV